MDAHRFDDLTRTLAIRVSRRGFLARMAGLVGGVVVATDIAAACPPGQIAASGGRCLCRSTGRPPVSGICPCPPNQVLCDGACSPPPCCTAETCPSPGVCLGRQCCQPRTTCNPGECGPIGNGCGGTFDCGPCCTPRSTCNPGECGLVDDGCGGPLDCGDPCVAPETCGGGWEPNRCGSISAQGTCATGVNGCTHTLTMCNGRGACSCFQTTAGATVCADFHFGCFPCERNADCGTGSVCIANTMGVCGCPPAVTGSCAPLCQ